MDRITTHPGEVLLTEFLEPYGISINKLSRDLDVPTSRMSDIANGKRDVTVDTAIRLAAYFGTTPEFWLNLQASHSLSKFKAEQGDAVTAAVRPLEVA